MSGLRVCLIVRKLNFLSFFSLPDGSCLFLGKTCIILSTTNLWYACACFSAALIYVQYCAEGYLLHGLQMMAFRSNIRLLQFYALTISPKNVLSKLFLFNLKLFCNNPCKNYCHLPCYKELSILPAVHESINFCTVLSMYICTYNFYIYSMS